MPSLCAIVINYNREKSFRNAIKPLIILMMGIVVFIAGGVSVLNKINHNFTCSHGSEMNYCKLNVVSQFNDTSFL
jgi:hypothetical protein